jgi:hypothetical protein
MNINELFERIECVLKTVQLISENLAGAAYDFRKAMEK